MNITFEQLEQERAELNSRWDVLLAFIGRLSVSVESRTWYEESDFPLAELALALQRWVSQPADKRGDFAFSSLESDTEGLLVFKRRNAEWTISAPSQAFEVTRPLSTVEIDSAVGEYVDRLRDELLTKYGFNLDTFFKTEGVSVSHHRRSGRA